MFIENLVVQGGFLNGMDVHLSPGLNVLIGARGTGKTSIIELIRYGLEAESHTPEASARSIDHALAVLGDGAVSLTLSDGFDDVQVARAAGDEQTSASSSYLKPIVLSQTEIETIGLSESGRLTLIDAFIVDVEELRQKDSASRQAVLLASKQVATLQRDLSSLAEGLQGKKQLQADLEATKAKQLELAKDSVHSGELQKQMTALMASEVRLSRSEAAAQRFRAYVESKVSALSSYELSEATSELFHEKDVPALSQLQETYKKALSGLDAVRSQFSLVLDGVQSYLVSVKAERSELERKLRACRLELEQAKAGTGAIAKRMSDIQTSLAKIQSTEQAMEERRQRLAQRISQRDEYIDEMIQVRQALTDRRSTAADKLNAALSPYVRIEVEPQAQWADYARSIALSLRGSGLKYSELSQLIATTLSPMELVRIVDSDDFSSLAELIGIQRDRAAKLLINLRDSGLGEIVTARLDDNVRMCLLDGVDYKDVSELSAGQRCTVVLSIVLQHSDKSLIIDQPEDHLDNAFIANTVIRSLRNKRRSGQVIVSTHNANIPVLGEADLVIELTSDGRHGYIQSCERLDHPESVLAISNVMEGGREAFVERANFYAEHISNGLS